MNETMVTVVGNVATAPVFREGANGSVARFRLAATARYRDRTTNAWVEGHTNFFTVWARWALGSNVAASLSVGEPVIVQGRLKVRTEDRDGQSRMSADIDAQIVGHDLSRGTAAFRRTPKAEKPRAAEGAGGGAVAGDGMWLTPAPDGASAGRAEESAGSWSDVGGPPDASPEASAALGGEAESRVQQSPELHPVT
jgi:single-strand DNA-binding protein